MDDGFECGRCGAADPVNVYLCDPCAWLLAAQRRPTRLDTPERVDGSDAVADEPRAFPERERVDQLEQSQQPQGNDDG